MSSVAQSIKPQRLHGESHEQYRKRRAESNGAIKRYLKGRFAWMSKKIVKVGLNANGKVCQPGEVAMMEFFVPKKIDGTYESWNHGPLGTLRFNTRNKRVRCHYGK